MEFRLKDLGYSLGVPGTPRGINAEEGEGSCGAVCRMVRRRNTDSWEAVTKAQIREVEAKAGLRL